MQNETIEATVAFIDISGFTAITEIEPADVVVKMLNTIDYLYRYVDSIS